MTEEIRRRLEQMRRGEVPEGYRRTKAGIFPSYWKEVSVGVCVKEYRQFSNDVNCVPVYSSSRKGLIPQSEYYNRKEAATTNLGYKVVPPHCATYRHMSDDDIFHINVNETGGEILVSAEYPVFTASENCDLGFLIPSLNESARFRYFCRTWKLGGTRTRLYFHNLAKYRLELPPLAEQRKIAEILSAQDKVIALKERLIDEKRRQKKCLMQRLLTGKQRLPGFSGEWETGPLGSLFSERVETNHESLELLAITGAQGVIPRRSLELKDNSSEDKSKYLKIHVGDIGYNTMRMWQGVSAYSNYEGIVSPAYTILKPRKDIDARYFAYLFKMKDLIFQFYRFSQGLVDDTRNLKYANFRVIRVFYPVDTAEQTAIADILSAADREIELLRRDLSEERRRKKALTQYLLSGLVRAT